MGSDVINLTNVVFQGNFNPRSPYGERPAFNAAVDSETAANISTHAPRMGSDQRRVNRMTELENFNPRSPYGERPGVRLVPRKICCRFQPTLPVWGATGCGVPEDVIIKDFNPRSPYGERPGFKLIYSAQLLYFNPRSPYGERRSTPAVPY